MAKTLRWGIIGVAGIVNRLLPAFRASATAELVGIASRTRAKAQDYADRHGIPNAYGRYEDLLADPNIDAVYVPLPNHLHLEWSKRAADAGKHVLCEKPLCPTAAEAAELVAYCRAKGVRLMDGFMWPHHPRTHRLRQLLSRGAIGPITTVTAAFTFTLTGLPTTNIRLQPQTAGGGLLDVGCYCTYAILWAFQQTPIRAFARATYYNGVDVALSGILTFADGRTALLDCGFTKPLRTWVEIVGTDAVIRIPNLWIPNDRAVYEIHRQTDLFDHAVEVVETPGENQMVHMLDDFALAVAENREPDPNPDESVQVLKVLDALGRSAKTGLEVAVAP